MLYKIKQELKGSLYRIKQELKGSLYKNICMKKNLATPHPSFPRKRESMLTLNLKWIPAYAGMTKKREVVAHV